MTQTDKGLFSALPLTVGGTRESYLAFLCLSFHLWKMKLIFQGHCEDLLGGNT